MALSTMMARGHGLQSRARLWSRDRLLDMATAVSMCWIACKRADPMLEGVLQASWMLTDASSVRHERIVNLELRDPPSGDARALLVYSLHLVNG